MPNWCIDRLTVTGEPDALAAFVALAQKDEPGASPRALSFEALVPMGAVERPDPNREVDPFDPSYGINRLQIAVDRLMWAGRDDAWRMASWGTKWDLDKPIIVEGDADAGLVTYDFATAYTPPCAFVEAVSRRFTDLRFELCYVEPGNRFGGRLIMRSGEFLVDEAWDGDEVAERLGDLGWTTQDRLAPPAVTQAE